MSVLAAFLNSAGDLVVTIDDKPSAILCVRGQRLELCQYGSVIASIGLDNPLVAEIERHARFRDDASVFLEISSHSDPESPVRMGDLRALLTPNPKEVPTN